MAEEEKEAREILADAAELERIISDDGDQEAVKESSLSRIKGGLRDKKIWIPLVVVFVIILAGSLYWFLSSDEAMPKGELVEPGLEQEASLEPGKVEGQKKAEENIHFKKVNSYSLEPFFIPLGPENSGVDQFISLKVTFLLSNKKLDKEIDKNIRHIRRQIYILLKNKNSKDFIKDHIKLKKRLKQEIITVSNGLLSSGVGTVSDVLFTNYMVK